MILNYFPTDPRGQAWFQFNHAQAHVTLTLQGAASNLANYLLDPMIDPGGPTNWGLNHQVAHDSAARFLKVQPSLNLADEIVGSPFWTFANWNEHNALTGAALAAGRAS